MGWNSIRSDVVARSIDDLIERANPKITIPKDYKFICNIGDIYYNFDSSKFAHIMVGEVTKVFPPDNRIDYEMVEIYWGELGSKIRGQHHEKSISVLKDYHVDINIAWIQYYIWNRGQEIAAISFAMNDIREREDTIKRLGEEANIDLLKDDYAEYFV